MEVRLHRRCRFRRLSVEVLEERTLLSIFTVDRLTDTGDGSGLTGDLRYCMTQATSGEDSIQFGVSGTINLSKALPDLISNVKIEGPGAELLTVQRNLGGSYRIFTVGKNAVVEISGLTIANGMAGIFGGGLFSDGTLTLTNVIVAGNSAFQGGGGIYNSPSGSLTIRNSTFMNNRVTDGTGGAVLNMGTLTLSQSTLSGNRAAEGAGVYNNASATLTISNCTIASNSGANDGGGVYSGGTLTVRDSTFSGNTAIDNGGGILSAGTLTVSNTTLTGNSISDALGSAIDAFGGPVSISDSTISGNMARSGFGTLALQSPMATVDHCLISGNQSGMAGAIVNNGTLTVSDCTISGNLSGGSGTAAGIVNGGTLTVSTSTISGNAGFAGGIWNSAMLTLSNSTISGNAGLIQGLQTAGGIANIAASGAATLLLLSCTIANNTVNGNNRSGSQLLSSRAGNSTSPATVELRNTLIAGDGSKPNCFADVGGRFLSDGHNLSSDDSGGFLTGSGDLINANPLLGPLQDNGGPTLTMALLPGSPALHAGDNVNAPATDQRGVPRSAAGGIDIGAFASRGFTLTVAGGDNQQTLVGTAFPSLLTVSVTSPFGEPVQGGQVTFTVPASGASATFAMGSTAFIDSSGQASAAAMANTSSGSYVVVASANGAAPASFHLTNLAPVTLSPATLPDGIAGVAYSQTVTASGGAGGPFSFAVTAGALPTGFVLSSDGTLSGRTTLAATFTFTVTATDAGGITGRLAYALTIEPAMAAVFVLSGFPAAITAGVTASFTITAADAFGNVATGYAGLVHFSSSDPQATLPPDLSLSAGTGIASATLRTAGTQWLTASDSANDAITGSVSGIVVSPAAATHLFLVGPSSSPAGSPFSVAVQALDAFGNTAAAYLGTVTFSTSDTHPSVVLPADYTFTTADSGVHIFTQGIILRSVGRQTIMAADTRDPSLNGSTAILVSYPVFLVTNTLDSGDGSLRQAILDADATPGPDIIRFAIGTGIQTITLASPLPALTQPIFIDGTSQPGYMGAPLIELNGAHAGPNADGLLILAGGSRVRGLVINRFSLHGIELQNGGGNVLEGNYLGTDVTGTRALGNETGLFISSSNNLIGGTTAGAGNVIAGNQGNGLFISNSTANVVQGNFLGTDPSGARPLGNGKNGVLLLNASGNTIGGTPDGAGNVIAFNGNDGVLVDGGSANGIRGNSIYAHSNGLGIELRNGGNDRLPFPVLTSASSDGQTMTVAGLLLSTPNTAFTLEFFGNPIANPSGFGEGEQFLGSSTVMTDSHGTASFTVTFAVAEPRGPFIAATVSDPINNTSGFSNSMAVSRPAAPPRSLGSGKQKTAIGALAQQEARASIQPLAAGRAELAPAPIFRGASQQPPQRRAIELLFGMRHPAERSSADLALDGLRDRLPEAIVRTISEASAVVRWRNGRAVR